MIVNVGAFDALSINDADFIDQESSEATSSSSGVPPFPRLVHHAIKYKNESSSRWSDSPPVNGVNVRVLFNFDPTHSFGLPAPGLAICRGSIIRIQCDGDFETFALDRELWWKATMILPSCSATKESRYYAVRGQSGLVPSRFRQENRFQRRKSIQVRFQTNRPHRHSGALNTLIRRMKRASSMERIGNKQQQANRPTKRPQITGSSDSLNSIGTAPVSYILVELVPVPQYRPVIILGAAVERITEDLTMMYPHVFRKLNERAKERLCSERKHPIMCLSSTSDNSINLAHQLVTAQSNHCPIVLLCRPIALEQLHTWLFSNAVQRALSTTQELYLLNAWRQILDTENALAAFITDVVMATTPEKCLKLIFSSIRIHAQSYAWMPIDQSTSIPTKETSI